MGRTSTLRCRDTRHDERRNAVSFPFELQYTIRRAETQIQGAMTAWAILYGVVYLGALNLNNNNRIVFRSISYVRARVLYRIAY